jgi:hypothetical protein
VGNNRVAKRKAKRKKYERERNIAHNQPKARFRLDVFFPEEGWRTMAGFKSTKQCEAYSVEQERIRAEGKVEILEGRIVDIQTGAMVIHIPQSIPEDMQSIKAAKAADPKGYLSVVKEAKSELVTEKSAK